MGFRYGVSCPGCGFRWPDVEARDTGADPSRVTAITTCGECFAVAAREFELTADEVERYARDVRRTVQKMYQAYTRALARLEEKRKVLAHRLRGRAPEELEPVERLDERLSRLKPPDTGHLDRRVAELEEIAGRAPAEREEPVCTGCGSRVSVHREGPGGFAVPCPRCRSKLGVRLRGRT